MMRILFIFFFATLLRHLVSLYGHSGQGKPPMYGDYEAQRHWMEVTLNIPLSDWYHNTTDNDLLYWGLDYPPLTAYVSWAIGIFSRILEPTSVALHSSRGYETPLHRSFMRFSVLVLDVCIYFTASFILTSLLYGIPSEWRRFSNTLYAKRSVNVLVFSLLLALAEPGLILIDHGHFQYNTVALGLALLGAAFLYPGTKNTLLSPSYASSSSARNGSSRRRRWWWLWCRSVWASLKYISAGDMLPSAVFFCLALNFKQMALYYAPAFFCTMLHRAFNPPAFSFVPSSSRGVGGGRAWFVCFVGGCVRVLSLGVVVIAVFALLWSPFCIYPHQEGAATSTVTKRCLDSYNTQSLTGSNNTSGVVVGAGLNCSSTYTPATGAELSCAVNSQPLSLPIPAPLLKRLSSVLVPPVHTTDGIAANLLAPCFRSLGQVLHRIFPLARGVFEDKVGNFWYAMSVVLPPLLRRVLPILGLASSGSASSGGESGGGSGGAGEGGSGDGDVYDIRSMFTTPQLAKLSLALTLLGLLPSMVEIFRYGYGYGSQYQHGKVETKATKTIKTAVTKPTAAAATATTSKGQQATSDSSSSNSSSGGSSSSNSGNSGCGLVVSRLYLARHLLAMFNSSIAFFLFSFQVHEKSILIPLAPLSFLYYLQYQCQSQGQGQTQYSKAQATKKNNGMDKEDSRKKSSASNNNGNKSTSSDNSSDNSSNSRCCYDFVCWFSFQALFSLFPLLQKDRQAVPYFASTLLYATAAALLRPTHQNSSSSSSSRKRRRCSSSGGASFYFFTWRTVFYSFIVISGLAMATLQVAEGAVPPPPRYPDLYPCLFALLTFGNQAFALIFGIVWQYSIGNSVQEMLT